MSYVGELRAAVGNRPLVLVGAAVLVTDAAGRLLLVRRADNGAWCPVGGCMEPGETVEKTAGRELREETGLQAGAFRLFGVFSGPELPYEYPNGDEVFNVTVTFCADGVEGSPRADGLEGTEVRFFGRDELPEHISPPVRPTVERWRRSSPSGLGDAAAAPGTAAPL